MIRTSAGPRVHIGIRFASVRRPNRSSADAWKSASTTTVALLTFFARGLGFATGAEEDDEATAATGTEAEVPGAGVPDRDGSALTVKSLPWTSIMTLGKLENLVSSTFGRRNWATVNKALTSGDGSVVRDHSYWSNPSDTIRRSLSRVTRRERGRRILLTTKSDSLSHMISCDTSGIVNVPLTLVPSLAEPDHFNIILQSKIVINLTQ